MTKIIDADELTIKALLDRPGNSFVVPKHQRQFEWTKDQWSDLWDDLQAGDVKESHFLGSIVVIPSDKPGVNINYFEVNDGQQRLTTILILLSAIRDQALKLGNNDFAQNIYEHYLTSNYFDSGSMKTETVPKMVLGSLDNQQFNNICEGKNVNNPQDDDHNVLECYKYFVSLLSDSELEKLEVLKNRVVDKIMIVHINVADKLNAFRLFETLNDRGLALSAVDLIKNHLLMRASNDGEEILLNSIVEEWLEMYQHIRDYAVTFFFRFMLSEYSGKISATQLYEVITKRANDENWDAKYILDFTIRLKNAAIIYSELIDANTGIPRIDRRLKDINLFEAGPSYTLLMKISPLLKNNKLEESHYLKIIDLIELFHIRWGVCGQSTSKLNDIYNRICTKLDIESPDEMVNIVEDEYLASASSISDSTFHSAFQDKFSQPSATRTKYIIWKLGNPAGEISLNFDEVHTEHIMPQTLSKEWEADLESSLEMDKETVEKTHVILKNKIGNLALIKGEWNIRMSNQVYSEKIKQYKNSEINLTKELSNKTSWTFEEIIQRSKDMADKAILIWKFNKPIPELDLASTSKLSRRQEYEISSDIHLFCKGPSADATANITDKNKVRVHKGSLARFEAVPNFEKHGYKTLRNQLVNNATLKKEGDSLVFTTNYDFSSASAAAAIVLGRSADGPSEWKDKNGKSIKELTESSSGGKKNKKTTKLWNWELFKDKLNNIGEKEVKIALKIIEWSEKNDLKIDWSKNRKGTYIMCLYDKDGNGFYPFSVTTDGNITWNTPHQGDHSPKPFNEKEKRGEILKELKNIKGARVELDNIDGYNGFSLSLTSIVENNNLQKFLDVCIWIKEELLK